MKSIRAKTILVSIAVALTSCALDPAPHYEQHFGEAVNMAKAQQTMNPDASKNPDPVAGIAGVPAVTAVGRYNKSFEAPPPTFTVIVGGGVRTQ